MNARKMNENVKATAIYFTYDHINHKIDGTEENFRLSGIPGSAQDLALMDCLREHPDYSFRIVKPKKEKNSYKGLGRELMHDYIDCFGSEDMMEKFQQMKKDGTAFATMKSWFLELFPKFNVEKAKKKIRVYRSVKVKAKYKVVKFAPKSNNKPGSNVAELPKVSGND